MANGPRADHPGYRGGRCSDLGGRRATAAGHLALYGSDQGSDRCGVEVGIAFGHLDPEVLLDLEQDLHRVERADAEAGKGRIRVDALTLDPGFAGNDVKHRILDGRRHGKPPGAWRNLRASACIIAVPCERFKPRRRATAPLAATLLPMPVLFLASRSPRRADLLRQAGFAFQPLDVEVPEQPAAGETAAAYVTRVARAKAAAGLASLGAVPRACVLAADTEVVLDGEVFGKPAGAAAARAMLGRLSGRTHEVLSAVCVAVGGGVFKSALVGTRVTFGVLDDDAIAAYVATGEAFGKAGAYAIQGRGAVLVARIEGSFSGVVGLPLHETAALLAACGVHPQPAQVFDNAALAQL